MRTLYFHVDQQRLLKDKDCDFTHIVAGSSGYLKASFVFSDEWAGCKKAASFYVDEQEYAVLLDKNNNCIIPQEALVGAEFYISVTGAKSGGYKIPTNRIKITQEVS